jgi:hypothetical protein
MFCKTNTALPHVSRENHARGACRQIRAACEVLRTGRVPRMNATYPVANTLQQTPLEAVVPRLLNPIGNSEYP